MSAAWIAILLGWVTTVQAEDEPGESVTVKYQITGLFCPEREQDLSALFAESLAQFKLASVDYPNAEATIEFDPTVVFPDVPPEQWLAKFDGALRSASRSTFGAKPLRELPRDKLKLIEIPIVGLDCKGCSLAVYESLLNLPGVEQAQASFREGKATALIDPEKTDRAELEKALEQRGVTLGDTTN